QRLFDAVRRRSEELSGSSLPIVWSHPDLGPSNVRIRPDGITIIDWTRGAPGLPLLDVLYFVLVAFLEIRGVRDERQRLSVCQALFLEAPAGDAAVEAVRRGLEECLRAIDADRRIFPVLLALLW